MGLKLIKNKNEPLPLNIGEIECFCYICDIIFNAKFPSFVIPRCPNCGRITGTYEERQRW
jgi:hypothetical protein